MSKVIGSYVKRDNGSTISNYHFYRIMNKVDNFVPNRRYDNPFKRILNIFKRKSKLNKVIRWC